MTEEVQNDAPNIGVLDLQNALKIIDAASERGAFKGNELSSVGAVRDKIAAFLDALPKEEGGEDATAGASAAPESTREDLLEQATEAPAKRTRKKKAE